MRSPVRGYYERQYDILTNELVPFNDLSQLPPPDGGVITLEDRITYDQTADIVCPYSIVVPPTSYIISRSIQKYAFVFVGGGTLFTIASGNSFGLQNIVVLAPAAGTLFDVNGLGQMFWQNCAFVDFVNFGTVSNITTVLFSDATSQIQGGNGMVVSDISAYINNRSNFANWKDTGGTMITYDSGTFSSTLQALNNFAPAPSETVFNVKSAATYGNGQMSSNSYTGVGTFFDPTGESQSNVNWQYNGNGFIADSIAKSFGTMQTNATATVIVYGVPIKIAGTWIEQGSERFIFDSTGRATYTGLEPIAIDINTSLRMLAASGSNNDYDLYVYKNGVQIPSTQTSERVDSADRRTVNILAEVSLITGDYVELWVEGIGHNVNVTFDRAKFILSD